MLDVIIVFLGLAIVVMPRFLFSSEQAPSESPYGWLIRGP